MEIQVKICEEQKFEPLTLLEIKHYVAGPFILCSATENGIESFGISKCRFDDDFSEGTGYIIAKKRALRTLEKKKKGLKITSKFCG